MDGEKTKGHIDIYVYCLVNQKAELAVAACRPSVSSTVGTQSTFQGASMPLEAALNYTHLTQCPAGITMDEQRYNDNDDDDDDKNQIGQQYIRRYFFPPQKKRPTNVNLCLYRYVCIAKWPLVSNEDLSTRDIKASKSCKCQNAPIIADAITKGFPTHTHTQMKKIIKQNYYRLCTTMKDEAAEPDKALLLLLLTMWQRRQQLLPIFCNKMP